MVLDGPRPFGVNVCRNDDGGQPMLIGQGMNFADAESFKNLMPLMRESFGERVWRTICEQDEYHRWGFYASPNSSAGKTISLLHSGQV